MTDSPDAPQSAIDICNLALDAIAEDSRVEDFNDTDRITAMLARQYPQNRRALLRDFMWNFAQTNTTLARLGDGAGAWDDAYLRPADCVRVAFIGKSFNIWDRHSRFDFTDSDGVGILINVNNGGNPLYLKYTRDITDVMAMEPLFIEVLSLRIAAKIAYPITKKKTVVDMVLAMLDAAQEKAVAVDGQERPPVRVERSKMLDARRVLGYMPDERYFKVDC